MSRRSKARVLTDDEINEYAYRICLDPDERDYVIPDGLGFGSMACIHQSVWSCICQQCHPELREHEEEEVYARYQRHPCGHYGVIGHPKHREQKHYCEQWQPISRRRLRRELAAQEQRHE